VLVAVAARLMCPRPSAVGLPVLLGADDRRGPARCRPSRRSVDLYGRGPYCLALEVGEQGPAPGRRLGSPGPFSGTSTDDRFAARSDASGLLGRVIRFR
jgi:hypothetical protein